MLTQSPEQRRKGEKSAAKTALKTLGKATIYGSPPTQHIERLRAESDRGVLVLIGSLVEEALEVALKESLPGATASDHKELFGITGPIGTFSSKALFARVLGLISEPGWQLIDVLRALRNSAAHHQQDISFATPTVMAGVRSIVSEDTRLIMDDDIKAVRDGFVLAGVLLQLVVLHSVTGKSQADPGLDNVTSFIATHHLVPVVETIKGGWVV